MLDMSEVRYEWVEKATKSGRPYLALNGNPEYVIFLPHKGQKTFWVAKSKMGYDDDLERCKAAVEGLFDHYSLPKDKRWMTI